MNRDKISIIIPVMNAEAYIRECLDSVVNQSYKNLEIIVVYTNSVDQTLEICENYKKEDERIKLVINNTDVVGPGVSSNLGLKEITGDYIGFVDADDVIARDMYETLYNILKDNHADIAVCFYTRNIKEITRTGKGNIEIFDTKEALREFLVGNKYHGELWSKLFTRECINNIKFIETGIGQDIDYVWRAFFKAKRIVYTNQKKYFYRYNGNGMTKRFKVEDILRKEEIYSNLKKDIIECFPVLEKQLNNRTAIINAQNYITYMMSGVHDLKLERHIIDSSKKTKFSFDGCKYRYTELLEVMVYQFSPIMCFFIFKCYQKIKGR